MAINRLKVVATKNNNNFERYLEKSSVGYTLKVYKINEDGTQTLVDPLTCYLTIQPLDNNVFISKNGNVFTLYANKEGLCAVASYYSVSEGEPTLYYGKDEFIVYDTFFKDNFYSFLPEIDLASVQTNLYLKCLFETLFEFFDIIYAYNTSVETIRDPINIKWKFLENLGNSMGFGKLDRESTNTPMEVKIDRLYRELLANLKDILSLKGTKLSYELFFNALGYDIDLLEFWFTEDGNLIEINPTDDSLSTFNVYNLEGAQLTVTNPLDPRMYVDPNSDVIKNNKSPYVKPIITRKAGFGSESYSLQERAILRTYLDFLKPEHVKYLDDLLNINIITETLYRIIESSEGIGGTALWVTHLMLPWPGDVTWYRNPGTEAYEWIPAYYENRIDSVTGMPIMADPGRMEWDQVPEHGTWNGSGGGMTAEYFKNILEQFILNTNKGVNDIIQTMGKYDRGLYYDDDIVKIYYDRGVFLEEGYNTVDVISFRARYNYYNGLEDNIGNPIYTQNQIQIMLMNEYDVDSTYQYDYLLNEFPL